MQDYYDNTFDTIQSADKLRDWRLEMTRIDPDDLSILANSDVEWEDWT